MTRAAEVLLASLIDYAGTFPPAKLSLADAIRVYALTVVAVPTGGCSDDSSSRPRRSTSSKPSRRP